MGIIKLFYATDLHGSEKCFRKFVTASKVYRADIMIIGGDLTGKAIIPFIVKNNGSIEVEYFGQKVQIKSKDHKDVYFKELADRGLYPYKIDEREYEDFIKKQNPISEVFANLMKERIKEWLKTIEKEMTDIKVIINAGNDDIMELNEILESSNAIIYPEGKVIELDGHEMISTGYANLTPWHAPRDISEEELREKIENMALKLKDPGRSIFNVHAPPYNSGLDMAPKLDKELRPIYISGAPIMEPVGSKAVREMIEKYQPMLGLHGHVHESRGAKTLNKTLIINPGSDCQNGILRSALILIDEAKVVNYMLTTG